MQPAPLYIIASPRPRTGKTLIARLMVEFFRAERRPLVGYDLNPREQALAIRFPKLVWPVDIATTRGQMELFDRLIADTASTKIIDLGYGSFDQFFAVMAEIGFLPEARRRMIEPIVLFVERSGAGNGAQLCRAAEPADGDFRAGAQRIGVADVRQTGLSRRPGRECGVDPHSAPLPIVRGVIDRPNFSFAAYMTEQPGGPTEVHQWVGEIFTEFRELELRLLMGRLTSSLRGRAGLEAQGMTTPRD